MRHRETVWYDSVASAYIFTAVSYDEQLEQMIVFPGHLSAYDARRSFFDAASSQPPERSLCVTRQVSRGALSERYSLCDLAVPTTFAGPRVYILCVSRKLLVRPNYRYPRTIPSSSRSSSSNRDSSGSEDDCSVK